jgi:WD40 repeat protein
MPGVQDGLCFVTGGYDKQVMLWTVPSESDDVTSTELGKAAAHKARVSTLAWCPDRSMLVSGSATSLRRTWIDQNRFEDVKLSAAILHVHRYALEERHGRLRGGLIDTMKNLIALEVMTFKSSWCLRSQKSQVQDLDKQFRLYDVRENLRAGPKLECGYRPLKDPKDVVGFQTYVRGSLRDSLWVRSSSDSSLPSAPR